MISLTVFDGIGPGVVTFSCNGKGNQIWMWNATDGTIRSKVGGEYLAVRPAFEIWAVPLSGGSQAVVLLNRGNGDNEQITVNWTDIGFPMDQPAVVRDLWARKDVGIFTGNYTSSNVDSHTVMMLNITLTK